jgi:hypothetical protein
MSSPPLTPTRKAQLEAYIACCRRVDSSIIAAMRMNEGVAYNPASWQARSRRVKSIRERMARGGKGQYALPLRQLRLARSKFAAELSGLGYHG